MAARTVRVIDQFEEKYRGFIELDEGGYRLKMNAP
jgi:hypothetical protein